MVTGCTYYKGLKAAQHFDFQNVFGPFLDEQKFDVIIEIGTLHGGLTRYFKDASPNSRIITFDIQSLPEHEELTKVGIEVRIVNIFENGHVADKEILEVLGSDAKKLIICDGGNKPFEFNCLAKYMKSGDFIMGHDFSYDTRTFREEIQHKVWNWFEISEKDISDVSRDYQLEYYKQKEFQSIVWVCKRKL